MGARRRFPWQLLVAMLGMAVAALCILAFIADRSHDDFIIINGYRVDGPADGVLPVTVVLAVASVLGGAGLVALRAFFRRISGPTRVDSRVFGDHV